MTAVQLHNQVRMLSERQRFVRSPDVLWRVIPGMAVVVLPPGERDIVLLSGTGLALWDHLSTATCLSDVATSLAAQYGVPPDDVVDSLSEVLLVLLDQGVVQDDDD